MTETSNFFLTSDRLTLRPPQQADIAPWMSLYTDPELTRYVGGPAPEAVARQRVLAAAGAWSLLGHGPFSVIERATRQWIGCVGPAFLHDWPGNELGWRLTREAMGKGYASEGAAMALDWAFSKLGWADVIHSIHPDNAASISVARRLGSDALGKLNYPSSHEKSELLAWGQNAAQWRTGRSRISVDNR